MPTASSGQERFGEEHLGETLVAVEAAEPSHRDPVQIEWHQQVCQSAVALRGGVRAEQSEEVGAERPPGGPGLLPVEHPAARHAAGPAGNRGEVAARVGLGPSLAPQVRCGGDAGQQEILLGLRAVLEDRRCQDLDPVLGDPLGGAGAPVLLFEDEPSPRACRRGLRGPWARTPPTSPPRRGAPPRTAAARSLRGCRRSAPFRSRPAMRPGCCPAIGAAPGGSRPAPRSSSDPPQLPILACTCVAGGLGGDRTHDQGIMSPLL